MTSRNMAGKLTKKQRKVDARRPIEDRDKGLIVYCSEYTGQVKQYISAGPRLAAELGLTDVIRLPPFLVHKVNLILNVECCFKKNTIYVYNIILYVYYYLMRIISFVNSNRYNFPSFTVGKN